jgi:hypothetical protein
MTILWSNRGPKPDAARAPRRGTHPSPHSPPQPPPDRTQRADLNRTHPSSSKGLPVGSVYPSISLLMCLSCMHGWRRSRAAHPRARLHGGAPGPPAPSLPQSEAPVCPSASPVSAGRSAWPVQAGRGAGMGS